MSSQGNAGRPNVLLICVDQWPGLLTRPAGHPVVMTPTVAQLANNGVCYTNAYASCPSCIPSRRSLMTGLTSRTHGDRIFKQFEPMPDAPTLPQCFRDAGYQAYAVGKLHVYPPRSRIGFDDVILCEEGRRHLGMAADDWDDFLADQGFAGQGFGSAMCSSDYMVRPWQLPERCHPTNWAVAQMCRTIWRRDPQRPAFWYLSFLGPHPPLWPPRDYLDLYRDVPIDPPVIGEWARDPRTLPWMLRSYWDGGPAMHGATPHELELARRGYYALITHIDHQLRLLVGTLREQGILDDTIIVFLSDHGEMLGDHGLWAKTVMYEMSTKVPLVIVPRAGDERLQPGGRDARLVDLCDIMPTLLEMCGIPVPPGVEGLSLLGQRRRNWLYAEHWEGDEATRMVRNERYKLVYYPVGNHLQLFDLADDPRETRNIAGQPQTTAVQQQLTELLIRNLYGPDLAWVRDRRLVGLPDRPTERRSDRDMAGQRGLRFPA